MERKQANWADPGRPGYRVKQKPVGKDRKRHEGPLQTNEDFPQSWTRVMGRALCAADVLPFDPSKRRKQAPKPAAPPENDPYNAVTMMVDYAAGDIARARDAARAIGEEAFAARLEQALRIIMSSYSDLGSSVPE